MKNACFTIYSPVLLCYSFAHVGYYLLQIVQQERHDSMDTLCLYMYDHPNPFSIT